MIKKGFIFDLDGVIVDTAKYHFLAWKKLANSIGIDFNKQQNEQLKGVSRSKSLEKILGWAGKRLSQQEFNDLMRLKNEDYLEYIEKMTEAEILPDVEAFLDLIIEKGHSVALGSASKNAVMILKKVKMLDKFDAIVDGNKVIKGKPDPEVFIKAAKEVGIHPENCLVFEDAVAGVQAANNAGMISVGIGDKKVLYQADYVFKDFREIDTRQLKEFIKRKK